MYVWFDALTNYISTLGWPNIDGDFNKFWVEGETLQLAGKDQVRFQSIIFQAMLFSAGIKPTDTIFYHGFINSGGQKMSKSIGNVISPNEMVARYGTDATRYILLRHVHPFDDSDLTWEKMDEYYTANLVNGLGNLVARVMKMAETHLDGPIEKPPVADFDPAVLLALDQYNFQGACDLIWKKVGDLDEKITTTEPFKLVKEDKEAGKKLIAELVSDVYIIGRLLHPIMPEVNVKIKEAVLKNIKPDNLFPRLEV
jgi:methionyl-tRNA synthetase